jgi:hypothetical protein
MSKLKIKSINPQDDFTIDIELSNSKQFSFDLKEYFSYPFTKQLQNINFFKTVKFKGELLYWNEMLDFPLHCMDIPEHILSNE